MRREGFCKYCVFWSKEGQPVSSLLGRCHRYPPHPREVILDHHLPSILGEFNFPATSEWDWCGEIAFKKNKERNMTKKKAKAKKKTVCK